MSGLSFLKRLSLISVGLAVLLLIFGAGVALAADNSSPATYSDDNYSEGFSTTYPHHCWRGFDTIFYGGDVWEAFSKGGHVGYPKEEMAVYLAKNKAVDDPVSKPTHYRVIEAGETWGNTSSRIEQVRFAVFKDKLFLFYAKSYADGTGGVIWQKQIAPLDSQYVNGNTWNPPATKVWETGTTGTTPIIGLVVKVVNDKLYILFQQRGIYCIWLVTSSDGVTFSPPREISTTSAALLNADVVSRGSDGAPLLAFVTKDDLLDNFGVHSIPSTGTCTLWTLDPATNAVSEVTTLPNKYRDVTVAAGDVAGCPPYGTTNLQLWGIGWDDPYVYHTQFVFNTEGTGGTFNPTGVKYAGSASSYVGKDRRGYLASCIAPEPVQGEDSLQQYARVWYWGSTGTSNAFGHSRKYKMDLLKWTGSTNTDTSMDSDYSPAWLLEGVIYGLPPYYPNGTATGHMAGSYNIFFALSASQTATNTVTSERTLSVSYKKQGIFGIPSASLGLSYTNSLQQASEESTTTKVEAGFIWSPDNMGSGTDLDVGAQAWGVFFVPNITNDRYNLTAPDGTDLDVTLYYTYISGGSNLINRVFDKTATPEKPNDMDPAAQAYWRGIAPYPNSLTYWDPAWSSRVPPPDGTYIYGDIGGGTDDYTVADKVWFLEELGGGTEPYRLSQTITNVESRSSTNTIATSGGVYGFEAEMTGSLTIGSSTSTTFGKELGVTYGLPGWDTPPGPGPDFLTYMSLDMYLLKAKTDTAFWIPDGARGQFPWCLTWHVRRWKSYGATDQHAKEGPAPEVLLGNTRAEMEESVTLPAGLRSALLAKLRAAKAAVDRGDAETVRNLLNAICNQVAAQSGKAIPTTAAERWIDFLRAIDVDDLMARQ